MAETKEETTEVKPADAAKSDTRRFEHETLKTVFTVPAEPTVMEQLAFYGETAFADRKLMFMRYWEGARAVILSWQSEIMPDVNTDLAAVKNPQIGQIVRWAGMAVANHMASLEEVDPNS